MSQRAAWQLERYGFTTVHDFVHGKAHWLASGRPTVRERPIDRVISHMKLDVATVEGTSTVTEAVAEVVVSGAAEADLLVVVGVNRVVLGTVRTDQLAAEDGDATVAEIMRLGPTTIRPDELTDDVRTRMTTRNVYSLLVTTPKGELLGSFQRT
ncbi:MAG: hypothetical protein ABIP17_10610 [Ilumatobacteraceae bacterium]